MLCPASAQDPSSKPAAAEPAQGSTPPAPPTTPTLGSTAAVAPASSDPTPAPAASSAPPAAQQAAAEPPVASQPPEAAAAPEPRVPTVTVSEHGTVTLAAQGIEITKLLELLSIKSRLNIVASEKVKALVSVSLYDVPIDQALDALLTVNGFVWERNGPFIMVYTRAEKDAMDKAKLRREPRVFTLQFLAPDDALALVKPLLSETGTAVSLGKVKEGFEPTIADGGGDTYAFATRVLVNDFPDVIEKASKVLTEADVQPQQVRVEATILVTDVNEEDAFGLDISLVGKIDFSQVTGGPMAAFSGLKNNNLNSNGTYPDPVPASASTASLFPNTEADPTLKMGVLSNDVAVFLQMLDQVKNTTVLARPTVTVLNRQKAQVNIGAKVGYLSTTQTQTSTTQEVQYIDTGIKLTFRAFISPDGMVRMELNPSIINAEYKNVKSVTGGTGTGTGDVQIPNQTTQELRTNVRVKSGQTIVLGGLFREDTVTTNRQVPGLGDVVPGVFSGQADKTVRQEVIFLVTPMIVQDPKSDLDGDKALKVIDAVQTGARAGLLPFSHAQIGGNYQLRALDAWRSGDREKAALYADQALRVAPNSPSMIQLREDIRADNAGPWRTKLDSLDLLPDYIRQKGMLLGYPQELPKEPAPEAPAAPAPAAEAAMPAASKEENP